MTNPWVLICLAGAWALSCWYVYEKGGDNRENEMRAHYATELENKIAEHNEGTLVAIENAKKWGAKNAAVKTKYVTIRSQANEATSAAPAPANCNLDDNRWRVLNAAIEAGSGAIEDASKRVPDASTGLKPPRKPER